MRSVWEADTFYVNACFKAQYIFFSSGFTTTSLTQAHKKKSVRFRDADQHILKYFEPLNPNPS